MNNSKKTRRALLSSVIALALCFSMFVGTTMAWFTDTASSKGNTIQSGTLDVLLLDSVGDSLEGKTLAFVQKTGDTTETTVESPLWEPGATFITQQFKLKNNGNLHLKYTITVTGIDGDAKLNEAIDWSVIDPSVTEITELTGTLAPGAESVLMNLKGHMKESAGNEYQGLTIKGVAITVTATQATVEYDSYSNQYDANAESPVVKTVTVPENNTDDVVLTTGTDETDAVEVTVPAEAAEAGDVYKVVVSNEVTEIDSVTSETTVAFDLTLYKNDEKVSGDTVYKVTKNVGAGLFISEVTHNGTALTAATTGADQTYNYDSTTGELTIYTASFSPFEVTYTTSKDYTKILNRGHNKNSEISVSTGRDLLPIVAVTPSIAGYTVYEGDTRIANEVTFSFSNVVKTSDENSCKVSFDLAVKDENGNELKIKEGKFNPYINTDLREYIWVYVNLLEAFPDGYSVSEVKVNDIVLDVSTGEYAPTNGYLIGSDGIYLQAKEVGTFEITLTK